MQWTQGFVPGRLSDWGDPTSPGLYHPIRDRAKNRRDLDTEMDTLGSQRDLVAKSLNS